MAKKSQTIVATSVPVPVQEVKQEEIEKVKQVDNVKAADTPLKKTKKTKKDSTTTKVDVPLIETVVVADSVASEVVPESKEAELVEIDDNAEVVEEEAAPSDPKKRNRRVVSKESFYNDFESFAEQFGTFLEAVKGEKGMKNTKSLIAKKLKLLQNDSYKLLKIRHLRDDKKPRTENNSGFMKPIKISNDLASFLDTNPEEPITRVHVTKKLCQYIKEKDLQNPADRREIVPDEKLKNLFNMGTEKLTYYSMQKQIQQHIFKI
jgi:chromatin remodeling complex protein RSC6